MFDVTARRADARANVFFLDVGVEGVEEQSDARVVHGFAQCRAIGSRVEEVGFEAVERLDRQRDMSNWSRVYRALISLDRPLPFLVRAPPAGKVADWSVERTRKEFRAPVLRRP